MELKWIKWEWKFHLYQTCPKWQEVSRVEVWGGTSLVGKVHKHKDLISYLNHLWRRGRDRRTLEYVACQVIQIHEIWVQWAFISICKVESHQESRPVLMSDLLTHTHVQAHPTHMNMCKHIHHTCSKVKEWRIKGARHVSKEHRKIKTASYILGSFPQYPVKIRA